MSVEWILPLIITTIIGALLTIIVQEIIHPPLKYKINKTIKGISKRIRDPAVPTSLFVKSESISERAVTKDMFIEKVRQILTEKEITFEVIGDIIRIKNLSYEKINPEVNVVLSLVPMKNEDDLKVSSFEIQVKGEPHFNTFSEEVLVYSQIANMLIDIIGKTLKVPISVASSSLTCQINHLDKITAILSDMRMSYMALRDGYELELGVKTATIYKTIGPSSIKSLKTLIQLYH